jgi:hypothetical protein
MARFQIVGGPSKMDLMLALFDSSYDKPRPVNFSLIEWPEGQPASGTPLHIQMHVTSVQKEDGSGESWNVEAAARGPESKDYTMYYSTRTRTGVANTK